MKAVGRVCVLVNASKEDSSAMEAELSRVLTADGVDLSIIHFNDSTPEVPPGPFDLAFCLGGDGSVLCSARALAGRSIPIFPINLGHLGFLAEISPSDWEACYRMWLAGRLEPKSRMMLDVRVSRSASLVARFVALNEGSIAGSGGAKLATYQAAVSSDGPGGAFEDLGSYRADGLIVATPTGSTAYSLAAGGPILPPDSDAIIFNPICPFTLSHRPVVLPGSRRIRVKISVQNKARLFLSMDGQESFALANGDSVEFAASSSPALILPSGDLSFYDVLRTKLSWSGGSDA